MKLFSLLVIIALYATSVSADGKSLASKLGLNPSSKAIKQWEKVFKKDKKMVKLGIDKLSDGEKSDLKKYLTNHAADSDHPEAAGM